MSSCFSTAVSLTNIIGLLGNHSALEGDHLDGIQTNLNDVIDEGQQRSERKRCHKYGGEAELDHCMGGGAKKSIKQSSHLTFSFSISD